MGRKKGIRKQQKKKMLIYLRKYKRFGNSPEGTKYPYAITSKGIAKAIGFSENVTLNALSDLEQEDYVERIYGCFIKNQEMKSDVYVLTHKGFNFISSEQSQNHDLSQMDLTSSSQEV